MNKVVPADTTTVAAVAGKREASVWRLARARPIARSRSFVRYLQAATVRHCPAAAPLVFLWPFGAARNPRGKGEVCFSSPTALSNEIPPPVAVGTTATHVRSRPYVRPSNRPLRGDLHFPAALQSAGVGTGWGLGQIEQSTFRRVLRWTSVGRSVGGEAESDHRNPRRSLARRPTDAQLHLFRKRKTNALYFRESDRH